VSASPSPANPESGSTKVVMLRPVNEGRFAHTLYQSDALELMQLGREIAEAKTRYGEKKDFIKAALHSGAQMEPGLFSLELCPKNGGGCSIPEFSYEDVVVKRRGKA